MEELRNERLKIPFRRGTCEGPLDFLDVSRAWRGDKPAPLGAGPLGIGQRDRPTRPAQIQMLGFIGIDGEMNRTPFQFLGDGIDHRVFHPHAGMMQFSLMPRCDDRLVGLIVPKPRAESLANFR